MKIEKWIDYLFEDEETGEEFFVEIDTTKYWTTEQARAAAKEIAEENFESPKMKAVLEPEEAEAWGLDTY